VFSNTSQYYAFAANPVAYVGTAPAIIETDYSTMFINDWQMLFGKKLTAADIVPVIKRNTWTSGLVYNRYDNTSNTLTSNNSYYVVTNPIIEGASYNVYKCIDNVNGGLSTVDPGTIGTPTQVSTFQTSDGYKWKYIYSISEMNYVKFSSENYVPVYTNSTISSAASNYSGVELVVISNSGGGYVAYTNGIISSVQNSTVVQIENNASSSDNYYVNNGIYIYNSIEATSQLRVISDYVANSSGKFVFVSLPLDTTTITPGISNYLISPSVVFETDGTVDPKAYTLVNSSNSISNVVMLDIGSNISWANVKIQSSFGNGAVVYAIVPPPGGHGFDPSTELEVKGFAAAFNFTKTENDTIPSANVLYNKIGLIKNPYALTSNSTTGVTGKGAKYFANTFNQVLTASITPTHLFTVGETVLGVTSGARGTVVFSNTTQVHISGDKYFIDGESIANTTTVVGTITINRVGDIYTKDLKPIYIENINNVNRSETQTEVFKLIIEI
jgi:hypothetical protein